MKMAAHDWAELALNQYRGQKPANRGVKKAVMVAACISAA